MLFELSCSLYTNVQQIHTGQGRPITWSTWINVCWILKRWWQYRLVSFSKSHNSISYISTAKVLGWTKSSWSILDYWSHLEKRFPLTRIEQTDFERRENKRGQLSKSTDLGTTSKSQVGVIDDSAWNYKILLSLDCTRDMPWPELQWEHSLIMVLYC